MGRDDLAHHGEKLVHLTTTCSGQPRANGGEITYVDEEDRHFELLIPIQHIARALSGGAPIAPSPTRPKPRPTAAQLCPFDVLGSLRRGRQRSTNSSASMLEL